MDKEVKMIQCPLGVFTKPIPESECDCFVGEDNTKLCFAKCVPTNRILHGSISKVNNTCFIDPANQ